MTNWDKMVHNMKHADEDVTQIKKNCVRVNIKWIVVSKISKSKQEIEIIVIILRT